MLRSKGAPTSARKIRFPGDTATNSRLEDIFEDDNKRIAGGSAEAVGGLGGGGNEDNPKNSKKQDGHSSGTPSFWDFFKVEMTRGYMLEHDEERYSARRQKVYSFLRIPREVERFVVYGIMQCADSFLYIHTFLPIRFVLALWGLLTRPIASCFGLRRRNLRLLAPAEICDLLKGAIWIACTLLMLTVDMNRVYHLIKSQSIIKLYIFYNMLEVGDRLLSAFGQDTIDALFWTATEPKGSGNRAHSGLMTHIALSLIYVVLHSFSIMFQATTLNVAVNSNNKSLLTIMTSNNFVELKGSVFKKFDKNNLFQLSCSDVRERFHLSVLLFIVVIQTMKEFDWSLAQFCVMLPDCFCVLITEMFIDWLKHAFITRFNELPETLYREYTTSLAYDMTQTRQKHAFSDHSDLVARRMGFIPFPLSVVLIKAIYSAVSFHNLASFVLCLLAYAFALGLRSCFTICALGKACKLMKEHQEEKINSTPTSMTNVQPLGAGSTGGNGSGVANATATTGSGTTGSFQSASGVSMLSNSSGLTIRPLSSSAQVSPRAMKLDLTPDIGKTATSSNSSPATVVTTFTANATSTPKPKKVVSKSLPPASTSGSSNNTSLELEAKSSLELGATALFSNSDVDLDDVCLNEHVLNGSQPAANNFVEEELARSEPDLSQHQQKQAEERASDNGASQARTSTPQTEQRQTKRTHKRSESEPSIQNIAGVGDTEAVI